MRSARHVCAAVALALVIVVSASHVAANEPLPTNVARAAVQMVRVPHESRFSRVPEYYDEPSFAEVEVTAPGDAAAGKPASAAHAPAHARPEAHAQPHERAHERAPERPREREEDGERGHRHHARRPILRPELGLYPWNAYPIPIHTDIQGSPGYALRPGRFVGDGYHYPPVLPVRFPSHPYDNPTYTPQPSYIPVPLPPPWRSDELNTGSDGGRYLRSMSTFDFFPGSVSGTAAVAAANLAVAK